MRLHFEKAGADRVDLWFSIVAELDGARQELGQKRYVAGKDLEHAELARSADRGRGAVGDRTGRSDQGDFEPACAGEFFLIRQRSLLCRFRQFFCSPQYVFDAADHVEGLLRDVVMLALEDLLKALDGVAQFDVDPGGSGELLGDVERLR